MWRKRETGRYTRYEGTLEGGNANKHNQHLRIIFNQHCFTHSLAALIIKNDTFNKNTHIYQRVLR